jgi:hypothetical protein
MSKHTPGTWIAPSAGVWTEDGIMIADCGSVEVVTTMREHGRDPMMDVIANARLIASAPRILLALKACIDAIRSIPRMKGEPHEKIIRDAYQVAQEAASEAVVDPGDF